MMTLVRPITLNFQEPIVFLLNLYIALIYGLLYVSRFENSYMKGTADFMLKVWFESFEIVFIEIYHFNLGQEGLSFVGILVGAFLVVYVFPSYVLLATY